MITGIETVRKSSRVCKNGNEVLKINVKYPKADVLPKIESFYSSLCDSAISFCGERIAEIAIKNYEEDMKNGVFFVGYKYSLSAQVLIASQDIFVIRTRAELCRGGKILSGMSFGDIQWWEIGCGNMVPPRYALKKYFEWQKDFSKIKNGSCILIEKNCLILHEKGRKIDLGEMKLKNSEKL